MKRRQIEYEFEPPTKAQIIAQRDEWIAIGAMCECGHEVLYHDGSVGACDVFGCEDNCRAFVPMIVKKGKA